MKKILGDVVKIKDNETGEWRELPAIVGESAYELAVRLGTFSGTEEEYANAIANERSKALEDIQKKGDEILEQMPDGYVEKNQGSENFGKFLGIDETGNVTPKNIEIEGGGSIPEGTYVKVNQGSQNSGKYLYVDGSGNVSLTNPSFEGESALIQIEGQLSLTIADNQAQILEAVHNSKYKYLYIPDGIKHWGATESKYDYPKKLSMDFIRMSPFYENMWVPNELNVHSSLRYKVNTNGTIRYDDVNEKTDAVGVLPWGICMLAEDKTYPSETVHFIVSNFMTFGFHKKKRVWELISEMYPIASMFNVKDTVADSDVVDLLSENLGGGYYSFAVSSDKWHNSQGKDMCFHFFPKTGFMKEEYTDYENMLVVYNMSIQETQYDSVFTTMAGLDAKTSGGTNDAECFYSRFQSVRPYTKCITAINVLESESYKYVYLTDYLNSMIYKLSKVS